MKDATINEVLDVRMSGNNAIEWPKLDVWMLIWKWSLCAILSATRF